MAENANLMNDYYILRKQTMSFDIKACEENKAEAYARFISM
jgi:hypothetical protein